METIGVLATNSGNLLGTVLVLIAWACIFVGVIDFTASELRRRRQRRVRAHQAQSQVRQHLVDRGHDHLA